MLTLDQIESGAQCTHKNTKLRYSVVEVGNEEVLLSPESTGMQDLVVPVMLFCQEFVIGDRYSDRTRGKARRGKRPGSAPPRPRAPRPRARSRRWCATAASASSAATTARKCSSTAPA